MVSERTQESARAWRGHKEGKPCADWRCLRLSVRLLLIGGFVPGTAAARNRQQSGAI